MHILEALLILLLESVTAYAALDLVFRRMPMEPAGLRRTLRRYGRRYALAGALFSAAGLALQWRLAGAAGVLVAPCNLLPWWAFWRFGLRKQLTFLFKKDGGHPLGDGEPGP